MTEQDNPVSESNISPSPIRITLRLTKPHPLINRTLQEEENRKKSDHYYRQEQIVDYTASKKQARTALAILDRLFKSLEGQGFTIALSDSRYQRSGTYACKGHDQCAISVQEIDEQVAHEPTAKEKAEQKSFGRKPPKWDSVPTGEFSITPGGRVDLRTEATFTASLARTLELITQEIERVRAIRVAREKQQRDEARRQRLKQEEEDRVKAFRNSAQSLEQYRIMMQYIEEVRRHRMIPNNQRQENQTLDQWLSWAEAQARDFHPLG